MAALKTPRGLNKPAKALWYQLVSDHPHLSEADAPLLAIYCKLFVEWEAAVDQVAETGALATSKDGGQYMSPGMQVVSALSHRVIRLARELGVVYSTRPASTRGMGTTQQPRIARFQVS